MDMDPGPSRGMRGHLYPHPSPGAREDGEKHEGPWSVRSEALGFIGCGGWTFSAGPKYRPSCSTAAPTAIPIRTPRNSGSRSTTSVRRSAVATALLESPPTKSTWSPTRSAKRTPGLSAFEASSVYRTTVFAASAPPCASVSAV